MIDGTLDFSGGVNSIKVSTIQSERNQGGLRRNELAWLVNGAVRDGGIRPRTGWLNLGNMMELRLGRWQGSHLYEPLGANPYFIASIAGRIYKVDPDNPSGFTDLSAVFGLVNPAAEPYSFFCQAEQFLVIQAGDYVTLPLIWDGAILRRSAGFGAVTQPQAQTSLQYSVTIQNVNAQAGVIVSAGSTSNATGGVFTGQIGPTLASFVVPAIGASVTVATGAPYKGAIGATIGISCTNNAYVTGQWTVTASIPSGAVSVPELPAAGPMDFYMGRIWYGQGKTVAAGDISGGTSGTLAYQFRDSVLKITENPLAIGGDGFSIPGNDGNIRGIRHSGNIDASLGQGRLYLFTRKAVYALQVPVTRQDWIDANSNNQPMMTVVQLVNGSVNDRGIVPVNGDLFYRSFEPGIRSLVTAVRYFSQPGNVEISANEQRLMRYENRALLYASSGIFFNNRLLETCLPVDHDYGITFTALAPMDFIPISGFNQQSSPVWEGMYQGLNIVQLESSDFGGLERAFAINASEADGTFQIWELTTASRRDNVDSRITMQFETPAWTWGDEAALKKLIGGEMWVDEVSGTVVFTVEYRPDSDSCWHLWHTWDICNIANSCEDPDDPMCYPTVTRPDTFRAMMSLPNPRTVCVMATGRPSNIGYQFQCRVTIKGWCRVRGLFLHAQPFERSLYSRLTC